MIREAVTTVDLDTAEATSKARDLDKRKGQTLRRARSQVWGKLRSRVGQTFGAVGGYSAVTSVARMHSGPVDPWVAALKPIEAAVQTEMDKTIGFSVTARRNARADTVARFKLNVGVDKANLAPAMEFFHLANKETELEEKGRNILRQNILGPSFDDVLAQATEGYKELLGKAFGYVLDGLIK